MPYIKSRDFEDYEVTSWFGMWRQRLVHWITNQPYIYETTLFPRTHLVPNP
jgi:aspartyl/asparaginyl-tRNA synthetase